MKKKDIVRSYLEQIRKGNRISFEKNGEKRSAWMSDNKKYIYILGFGMWACKNTFTDLKAEI